MESIDINLTQWQADVFFNPARFKILRCGRRAGKTYLAVTTLLKAVEQKPGEYWFVAPTYKQSKEIAFVLLKKLIPNGALTKVNETELAFYLINGAIIKLKGADNPDSLRGIGLDGVVMDEYAFIKPQVYETIIRPMLFDRNGWALFISTPDGYNHFYDMWEEALKKPDDWARFHFTSYDNPHINPKELDEAKIEMSPQKFSQEIMAEFTKVEGAVWPEFSRTHHLAERYIPKNDYPIFGSIDFGFAKGHPTAFQLHEVRNDEIITFDGFTEEGLAPQDVAEKVRLYCDRLIVRGIFADTARPDLIEVLRRKSFPMREALKDIELGVARVAESMRINPLTNRPRWRICEHMTEAIRQIENYRWEEVRGEDGIFKQLPKKFDDDNPDALRYFLFNYNRHEKRTEAQVRNYLKIAQNTDFFDQYT